MSDKFLPCPFCDGKAHTLHVGDWWVEHACKKLGTYIRTRFCETEEEAVARWNTRAERACQLEQASWDDGQCTWGCICSACDAHLEHETGIGYNYCPMCGAKVVK